MLVSWFMVVSLVLASCAPAEEEEVVVVPGEEEEEVPVEEEVAPPEKEMIRDSLGRLVEKPKYGGVFVYCASTPIRGFDEANTMSYQAYANKFTNEELITGDWTKGPTGTNEISWLAGDFALDAEIGGVAESWEILDEKTVRFHIRKGIHFALNPASEASQLLGSRELNAHDVAYSLRRHFLTPGCYMQAVHTAEEQKGWDAWAEDDWTVIHQWNPELARVIFEYSDFCAIVAEEVIEKYGDMRDWRVSHGTGPFMLVDHVEGSCTTFVRNPDYWRKHPLYPEDTMPYLDGIKYLIIPDLSTRLSAMRTGKIDYLALGWEEAEDLQKTNPELPYIGYSGASTTISMNMANPNLPWADKRVRHALSLAIDQQAILDDYYGGHGKILAAPVVDWPEFSNMFTPLEQLPESTRQLYEYHPDKAKQLLAEAGYPNGFQAKVLCTSGSVDMLSIIKAYWEAIGVDLQIDVRDAVVFTSIVTRKKQEGMVYPGTQLGSNPTKFSNYYSVGPLNYSLINDPRVNEAIEKMDASGWDFYEEHPKILKELFPYILEECWDIVLPASQSYKFWQPWVKDYHGEGSVGAWQAGFANWKNYIWIDQDLKKEMTGRR